MPKGTTDKRRLIKFSNYSMCITLPKWVIDQLAWQKGDQLTLTTDVKKGTITLYKDGNQTPRTASSKKEEIEQPQSIDEPTQPNQDSADELTPIPKLRW